MRWRAAACGSACPSAGHDTSRLTPPLWGLILRSDVQFFLSKPSPSARRQLRSNSGAPGLACPCQHDCGTPKSIGLPFSAGDLPKPHGLESCSQRFLDFSPAATYVSRALGAAATALTRLQPTLLPTASIGYSLPRECHVRCADADAGKVPHPSSAPKRPMRCYYISKPREEPHLSVFRGENAKKSPSCRCEISRPLQRSAHFQNVWRATMRRAGSFELATYRYISI